MAGVKVGDSVTVPGDMYGTVKFVGPVAGKKGTFAGVQLAAEYAPRGKNSGDVDGRFYFKTTVSGSGIFLPIEKAVKRSSASSTSSTSRASPGRDNQTPTRLTSFNQGGRTPAMQKPSFSQSVGPGALRTGGAASPALKPPSRRESLPRPQSPLRKANTPAQKSLATPKTRPSAGFSKSTIGGPRPGGSARPKPGNAFSQSLRQPSTTPIQTQFPPLGPESSFDELPEEADSTPTPTPAPNRQSNSQQQEEVRRLQALLDEKDRALEDQTAALAEMDRNITELHKLLPSGSQEGPGARISRIEEEEDLPRDVVSLRSVLREKNERIKILTAEFDSNRADFRSTIDTLEMASTETERVYEKRVDELLEEVRNLQDRSEDVESVAQQLKQLEELVQELEEGLEDARRGEADARGEVEFLKGEVERSRSELRRERERLRTEEQLNGFGSPGSVSDREQYEELQSQLDTKTDEIRGLKAIINNLNNANEGKPRANGVRGPLERTASQDEHRTSLQRQIQDLESLLQQKSALAENLENENNKLRNSISLSKFPMPGSPFGLRSFPQHNNSRSRGNSIDVHNRDKHQSSGTVGSQHTVVLSPSDQHKEWQDRGEIVHSPSKINRTGHDDRDSPTLQHANDDTAQSETSSSSAALWCEICEEGGHDILTCGNMISGNNSNAHSRNASSSHVRSNSGMDRPAPLVSRKSNTSLTPRTSTQPGAPPLVPPPPLVPTASGMYDAAEYDTLHHEDESQGSDERRELKAPVEGTGEHAGMWAGKKSGMIDPEKWCALCERDGHESVDCPIEDAF